MLVQSSPPQTTPDPIMNEIQEYLNKYDEDYLKRVLASTPESDELAFVFFEDVAEIFDILSRMKHLDRNPSGFSLNDAPILGLLIRTWKLLKLVLWIYSKESAEHAVIAERSLIESAITATYLMRGGESTIDDYRRCSYADRLTMLKQAASGDPAYNSKAGRRLVKSFKRKLALEGLDENSFDKQIDNGWKLEGKTIQNIYDSVVGDDLYRVLFGISSESVHGSWQDVRHFSLQGSVEVGFQPLYEHPDVDGIGTLPIAVQIVVQAYREWVQRVKLDDPDVERVLNFIDLLNCSLFEKYRKLLYDF